MEQTNKTRFKKIKTRIATIVVIVFMMISVTMMCFGNSTPNTTPVNQNETEYVTPQQNVTKIDTIQPKQQIENDLIVEVSKYVKSVTPRAHQFIPKYIVQAGLANDIDICFMLAQTQIETTFGTAGAGRESSRRSLFGVAVRRYSNYESAVNDYCEILKKSYLVRGKTEKHLMAKYVTAKGARYAGNPNYERELAKAYSVIKSSTNIYSLQQEYKKL